MRIGFRAYAFALTIVALAVVGTILTVAVFVGPSPLSKPGSNGDLTRLGWYANTLYAPTRPQLEFQPPRFRIGAYEHYHDVVILGDSFSESEPMGWPNYVAEQGWSVVVVPPARTSRRDLDVDALLGSPVYRAHPPKVFIYQSVERALKHRFSVPPPDCTAPMGGRPTIAWPPPATPERGATRPFLPDLKVDLDGGQIAFARDFILANLRRPFRRQNSIVYRETLRAPRFSSRRPQTLLFLSADLETASLESVDLDRIRCGLIDVQRRVEAAGTTRFVAMIAPDKRAIYAPDIVGAAGPGSVVPKLVDPRLALARLDLSLRQAVEAGELDVYLPNDTHWGAVGHRVAADTVLDQLRGALR